MIHLSTQIARAFDDGEYPVFFASGFTDDEQYQIKALMDEYHPTAIDSGFNFWRLNHCGSYCTAERDTWRYVHRAESFEELMDWLRQSFDANSITRRYKELNAGNT